jgi:RNA polymerase sigma-70 factor (ECF subfamily)
VKSGNEETYKIIGRKGKEGISLLYERYGKRLYSYAVFNWKLTEDESWDIVYKTLYKVIETSPRYEFESEKKFGSFVFKVFVNYLRQYYRDTKRTKEYLEVTSIEETFLPPGTLESKEDPKESNSEKMNLLKQELEQLEDWERMLLLLRSQDMPYSEIAKYVDKPAEQLKVYYQRLKTTVTKRINEKLNSK